MQEISLDYLTGVFMMEDQIKMQKFNSFNEEQIKDALEKEQRIKTMYEHLYIEIEK